jgi:hypothetical protein
MKIGDLVESVSPFENLIGCIIDIQWGRLASDGLREIKVEWFNYKHPTWAMKRGIKVINESR